MWGALLMVIVLVLVIPPVVLISCGFVAAALGFGLKDDAEQRHQGSELVDLNQ